MLGHVRAGASYRFKAKTKMTGDIQQGTTDFS